MAFFGVNFILQKFCPCKKNDKYEVCVFVFVLFCICILLYLFSFVFVVQGSGECGGGRSVSRVIGD